LCATSLRSGTSQRCGRAQVRSYRKERRAMDRESMSPVGSLWERTLCATNQRISTPRRGGRAQGALPQTSRLANDWRAKADAKRDPASSPQRFRRVAQPIEVPAVYPWRLSHNSAPQGFDLIPARCFGRYQAILFGLLSTRSSSRGISWDSKRKVTRAPAAVRNARRVPQGLASRRRRHAGLEATTRNRGSGSRPAPG